MVNSPINLPAAAAKPDAHSIGFNLGAIALCIALVGLGIAYVIDAAGRAPREASSDRVTRTLGGRQLSIPSGWLREDGQRAEGFARQVELTVELPLGAHAGRRAIDLTLLPRSRVRPSAALLDSVYLHEFMPETLSGPPGLVGKPLVAHEGFAEETVWYDALSPAPFVAKCLAPLVEGAPGRCLRTVYLGPGIAAVYSFDEDVLVYWDQFDAGMEPLLRQIGAL